MTTKFKQGQRVKVISGRKGTFNAIIAENFDSKDSDFVPLILDQAKPVEGMSRSWIQGDSISVRFDDAVITLR